MLVFNNESPEKKNILMLLFKVEDRFMITGRGLMLTPGVGKMGRLIGAKIRLVRPDKTTVDTIIRGIEFFEPHPILVGGDLSKEDVPIGTEVWLNGSLNRPLK